jgi:hypothetical protein
MGQLQSNRLPADPARGIDPEGRPRLPAPFEQACQTFGLERTISYGRLPGGLVMLNWPLQGNDWHWGLERAFTGDPTDEAELFEEMQAHSLRFAAALEEASGGWLQLGDAFPADAGSPAPWLAAMPYWREGRRMIGRHTVIEQELLPLESGASMAPLPRDPAGEIQSIAVGNYANDHHYPGPDWPLAPKSCVWGGRWTGTPFCIPYGALMSAELDNLLASDKAFSTSHMANGATRLQPLILNIGQAAGAAAALALRQGVAPAELAVGELQEVLISDAAAPSAVVPLWDTAWDHPQWQQRQRTVLRTGHHRDTGAERTEMSAGDSVVVDAKVREQQWSGTLGNTSDHTYALTVADGSHWPVMTLEPFVNQQLNQLELPAEVELVASANPWGPWLRVSRLGR